LELAEASATSSLPSFAATSTSLQCRQHPDGFGHVVDMLANRFHKVDSPTLRLCKTVKDGEFGWLANGGCPGLVGSVIFLLISCIGCIFPANGRCLKTARVSGCMLTRVPFSAPNAFVLFFCLFNYGEVRHALNNSFTSMFFGR
jgi:hypothetical protein